MVDIIVISLDEVDGEHARLAQSLDGLFCGGNAVAFPYNDVPGGLGAINNLFIVGHANISEIGEFDVDNIIGFLQQFTINANTKIFLAGCSTGDSNQQSVEGGGFFAGLPLAGKIKERYQTSSIYFTKSTLRRRRDNGELFLAPSLNQGITGNERGAQVFTRLG
jgi:hypothetical protein